LLVRGGGGAFFPPGKLDILLLLDFLRPGSALDQPNFLGHVLRLIQEHKNFWSIADMCVLLLQDLDVVSKETKPHFFFKKMASISPTSAVL
jgi:hypothetical protein